MNINEHYSLCHREYIIEVLVMNKFFDNQSNEIWKIIKFPSIYSTETFCKYYTKIVEEYLSYSTSSKINFKYLKL